jgi:hypothetical protein
MSRRVKRRARVEVVPRYSVALVAALSAGACLLPKVELLDADEFEGGRGNVGGAQSSGGKASIGGRANLGGAVSVGGGGSGGQGGMPGGKAQPFTTCPAEYKIGPTLFDDLEDGDGMTRPQVLPLRGFWFTYNDMTGTQMPVPDGVFLPRAPGSPRSSVYAACTQGSGFTEWGAGIGFNMADIGEGRTCPIDISGTQGLRFSFRGVGNFQLTIPRRATASAMNNGTCTGTDCDYGAFARFPSTADWTTVSVAWSRLSDGVLPFSPEDVFGFQFQAYDPEFPDGPPIDFEFCVDDVELY